jgi:hypothetical protein
MVSDNLKHDLKSLERNMRKAGMPDGTHRKLVLVACGECRNNVWVDSKDNLGQEPATKRCSWCDKDGILHRVDKRVMHITLDENGSNMWIEDET